MDVYKVLDGICLSPRPGVELEPLFWRPQNKPVILVVINEKGGVGKTSLVNGLAAELAFAGVKVLVVDLDGRGTATHELGVDNPPYSVNDLLYIDPTSDEVIDPRGLAAQAIVPAGENWPSNVHVLPAERALANRETDNTSNMEIRLRLSLEGVAENYDIVLIDVPARPGGKLPVAALLAGTHALIPATLDEDGYTGIHHAGISIRRARLSMGLPPLKVVGIVRNIVNRQKDGITEMYDGMLHELYPEDGSNKDGLRLLGDVAVPKYVVRQYARTARSPLTAAGNDKTGLWIRGAYRRILNHVSEAA